MLQYIKKERKNPIFDTEGIQYRVHRINKILTYDTIGFQRYITVHVPGVLAAFFYKGDERKLVSNQHDELNVLKFQTFFSFCSQMKC